MQKAQPVNFSVIIVNYNTADLLERCLQSLKHQGDIDFQVFVVDNASSDRSVEMIRDRFPWVRLFAKEDNLGFARANNLAFRHCHGKYVYFLNPDTEVKEGSLRTMMDYMDSHPEVGLAGTKVINPDGSLQSSFERRYPGERHAKGDLKGLKGDIAWVLGASMIARRGIIEQLGGFDERFFLYGEDQDLCLAVRKAGWIIGFIPEAVVVHWGGQSERENLPAAVWEKKVAAELIFYRKYYSSKTIRAIRRANMIQALWRIMTLNLMLPFLKDKSVSQNKLDKYRLVLKTYRKFVTVQGVKDQRFRAEL